MKYLNTCTWIIVFLIIGCKQNSIDSSSEKNSKKSVEITSKDSIIENSGLKKESEIKKNNEKIIFRIPPPSGPGSGVCEVTLTIDGNYLIASETCGGHDENGHTESSQKLFRVDFLKSHKYKVSKLINTNDGNSFGCEYFEIKENKLYLYDENLKIINDGFCCFFNKETCDCIFTPTEN